MTNQDHPAYTGPDVIDETSAQSFPASDAPGWAIGRSYQPAPSTLATTAAANIRITRRFFDDVLVRQSGPAMDEVIAPGAVIDLPTGRFTGPDGVRAASTRLRSVFPDLRVEVKDLIAAGNQVVVTWQLCGTQQRELFGVPPTGRRECSSALSQLRIENNKIVEHQMTEGEASPEGSGPDRFAKI